MTTEEDALPDEVIEHYEDLNFSVRVKATSEHIADVTVLELLGKDSETGAWLYQEANAVSSPTPTDDITKAEWFLRGSIKWDGCSNLEFNDGDVMLHFCGKRQAMGVGIVLGRLYDLARKVILSADFSIAG